MDGMDLDNSKLTTCALKSDYFTFSALELDSSFCSVSELDSSKFSALELDSSLCSVSKLDSSRFSALELDSSTCSALELDNSRFSDLTILKLMIRVDCLIMSDGELKLSLEL